MSQKNFWRVVFSTLLIFLLPGCNDNIKSATPTTGQTTSPILATQEHSVDLEQPLETSTPEVTPWPQSNNDELRHIFTSQPNCVSPCWLGLTPGQATRADVLDLLNNFGTGEITIRGPSVSWISISSIPFSGEARFREDILEFWSFRVGGDALLSEVIEVLGEPDFYKLSVAYGQHGEFGWHLTIFYDNHGLVLVSSTWDVMEPEQSNFQPECQDFVHASVVPITDVYTVDPRILIDYDSLSETEVPEVHWIRVVGRQDWPGFGEVSVTDCWPGTVQ